MEKQKRIKVIKEAIKNKKRERRLQKKLRRMKYNHTREDKR